MFGSYNVLREIYIHLNCGVNVILADNVNVRLDPVNFDLQKTSFPLTCLAFFSLESDTDECNSYRQPDCGEAQCVNTPGSYVCQCKPGYKFNEVSKTCEGL